MPNNDSGFSVLEAIIAIAIMSLALLPLLSLQGQFVKTAHRIEQTQIILGTRTDTLNYLKSINFFEQTEGEFVVRGKKVTWHAVPVFEPRMSRGDGGGQGRFEMALYDVKVSIYHDDDFRDDFSIRGLGWKSTRGLFDGF